MAGSQSQGLFAGLCLYILAQGYTVPVWMIGPSWAIWPQLADFVVGFLALCLVLKAGVAPMSPANRTVWRMLLAVFAVCGFSYAAVTCLFPQLGLRDALGDQGPYCGLYQLYRLVEFGVVFLAAAQTPLTPQRIRILQRVATAVLVWVCATSWLVYFSVLDCSAFAPHISADPAVAGPWASYAISRDPSRATISYNHSYTSAQLLLLVALRMYLAGGRAALSNSSLLLLTVATVFTSGARAGLAGAILFALLVWASRPLYVLCAAALAGAAYLLIAVAGFLPAEWTSQWDTTVDRQTALLAANDADSLNGRDQIWNERLEFLNDAPARWVIGAGFGTALESGQNAHMQYLHVVLEMGLIGLLAWLACMKRVIELVLAHDTGMKPVLWLTVALLFSSLTQETLYPVAAMGHFTGFFLCAVAIALRRRAGRRPRVPAPERTLAQSHRVLISRPDQGDCQT